MSDANNPRAFPTPVAIVDPNVMRGGTPYRKQVECAEGMDLRDWFAGQALLGLLASPNLSEVHMNIVAASAFDMADAMLAERERRG